MEDKNKPPTCTNCKRAGKDHKRALTLNTCPSYLAGAPGSRRRLLMTRPQRREILRVGQLNLRNSKAAGYEARHTMADINLDILLAQEPYSVAGKVRCFGLSSTNLIIGNQPQEARPMAAIICKPELEPLELLQYNTTHFSVMKIRTSVGPMTFV
ncbi:hypothetical protein J6590_031276 [Homalodisca vitripennis]|nr:hypothetical protein J6590_031276 [Homalodisca vitripennis]